ncbi:nucleopolyhedrovirus P10 family protein, partial [Streptomyces sp. SID4948]|nr:nucleopolyhedrovirus P10 family protein [Streptomyces sp. SID4948]
MTMDRLTRSVREQVALGRLLPLGGPQDLAWITESAAVRALRQAAAGMSGVRLREVAVLPADWDEAELPAGAPTGALPHLPVRVEAAFDAAADEPLPLTAQRLRDVLWEAAADGVGLRVSAVDLRITGLLADLPALPPGGAG